MRDPGLTEIAEEIGVGMKDVACALDAVSEPVSFFEPAFSDEDEGTLLLDRVPDEKENADIWSERIALREALKEVPERELSVLISEKVGVSQAQVSRMEKAAVARLRELLT